MHVDCMGTGATPALVVCTQPISNGKVLEEESDVHVGCIGTGTTVVGTQPISYGKVLGKGVLCMWPVWGQELW